MSHCQSLRYALDSNCTDCLYRWSTEVHKTDSCGWTSLHFATKYGELACLKFLIDHGADVNARSIDGITPLYLASSNNHIDCVGILLFHGADVNFQHENKWTPLHVASYFGYRNIVQILLDANADRNIRAVMASGMKRPSEIANQGHVSGYPTIEYVTKYNEIQELIDNYVELPLVKDAIEDY
jgi:ankyrin repeat protein